jgi:hypothetical protein
LVGSSLRYSVAAPVASVCIYACDVEGRRNCINYSYFLLVNCMQCRDKENRCS